MLEQAWSEPCIGAMSQKMSTREEEFGAGRRNQYRPGSWRLTVSVSLLYHRIRSIWWFMIGGPVQENMKHYTPSIPPPKIYIQVWWFLTRWCVQEYMKYNPLPSPHPTSNAPKNYGARYIRKIGHLSGNLIS